MPQIALRTVFRPTGVSARASLYPQFLPPGSPALCGSGVYHLFSRRTSPSEDPKHAFSVLPGRFTLFHVKQNRNVWSSLFETTGVGVRSFCLRCISPFRGHALLMNKGSTVGMPRLRAHPFFACSPPAPRETGRRRVFFWLAEA